jgi:hypothetical protein
LFILASHLQRLVLNLLQPWLLHQRLGPVYPYVRMGEEIWLYVPGREPRIEHCLSFPVRCPLNGDAGPAVNYSAYDIAAGEPSRPEPVIRLHLDGDSRCLPDTLSGATLRMPSPQTHSHAALNDVPCRYVASMT